MTGGYQVTDHLKVTVGYDLLYWSAVVRAADQIAVEPTTGYPYGTVRRQLPDAAAVHLERIALLRPGPASGRRVAVLSKLRYQCEKRAGNQGSLPFRVGRI